MNDKTKALGKYETDESKRSAYVKILTDVQESIAQPDPVQGVRLRILYLIIETAFYQVLVIPPKPELDESGLRSFEGITGELKSHIPELVAKDEHLKELFLVLMVHDQTTLRIF